MAKPRSHKNEADEARKNPGKWVPLPEDNSLQGASQRAWKVKNGDLSEFKDGDWDAKADGRNVSIKKND